MLGSSVHPTSRRAPDVGFSYFATLEVVAVIRKIVTKHADQALFVPIKSYHVQTDLGAGYGIKRSVNIVWEALELRIGD